MREQNHRPENKKKIKSKNKTREKLYLRQDVTSSARHRVHNIIIEVFHLSLALSEEDRDLIGVNCTTNARKHGFLKKKKKKYLSKHDMKHTQVYIFSHLNGQKGLENVIMVRLVEATLI